MVLLPVLSIPKCRREWNTLCLTWVNPCVRSSSRWRRGDLIIKNRRNKKQQARRIAPTGLPLFALLYHSEVLQCLHDCFFFLRRALWLLGILLLRQIIVLPNIQPTFPLHLRNIQRRYL